MINIFGGFPEYCENVTGFWLAQPLNAITNLAYTVGGFYLYAYVKKNNLNRTLGIVLSGLMIILGIGSTAWHSHKSVLTMLSDEIPIYLFIVLVIYYLVQSLVKKSKITTLAMASIAVLYYLIFTYLPGAENFDGSFKYAFVLVLFLILNFLVVKKLGTEYNFFIPLGIFAAGIALRVADLPICQAFPVGTHFLWHILVAIAMYFGSKVILRIDNNI